MSSWLRNEFGRCQALIRRNVPWLLLGLAIRLLLMPFATHGDLIAQVWMTNFVAPFSGNWNPYSSIENTCPACAPIVVYPAVFMYFQAGLLRVGRLLLPDLTVFISGLDPRLPDLGNPYYLYPHIHELLMLLKFPYLIFDISTGIVLSLVPDEANKSDFLFKFWMLNPIAIFVSFIFSQFDIIPTFFVILSVYLATRSSPGLAAVSLGLGATFKVFPLMLLPIMIVGVGQSLAQRVKLSLLGIAPFVLTSLPFVTTKSFRDYVLFSEQLGRVGAATINVGYWDVFAIFVALYTVIVLHCFNSARSPRNIWRWMFAVLLCFYSFAIFHPQWFVWVAPLAGLAAAYNKKTLWHYLILCVCFAVYTFYWGTALAGNLFAPLDPVLFRNLPAPTDLVARIVDPARFIVLFRSVFTGTALWCAFLALNEMKTERAH